MIADALRKAGATLREGRWNYREKPIQVRFIIRVEEERGEVGDLIRAELDKAGLTVIPVYDSFAPAILTVYGSDPQLFQWHLYTEGWGKGVTEDVASGPRSLWTLREAYVPGKDTLTIGNLWVWTERSTWNPIGGFGDVYSNDIWQNVYDPPLWRHPFTGVPIPFRATYQVTTAGPT